MKLEISPTYDIRELSGVPVRVWRGKTDSGAPVAVLVAGIQGADDQATRELEKELLEAPWIAAVKV